jgi:hypothetical protein
MSFNHYSILGINTEKDLEELKVQALSDLKSAKIGTVADNVVHFPFGAVGFVDIFIDQKEIRIEVQAEDEESLAKGQELMQKSLYETVGYVEEPEKPHTWRDVTQAVLSEKAKEAKNAKRDTSKPQDPAK